MLHVGRCTTQDTAAAVPHIDTNTYYYKLSYNLFNDNDNDFLFM